MHGPKKRFAPFEQYLLHDLDEIEKDDVLETAVQIGLVVWRFNVLERLLDRMICEAINDRTDAVGLIVIHGMQYMQKVELFRRLCEELHGTAHESVPAFDGLIDALKSAAAHRNLVVHADWNISDAAGFTFTRVQIKDGDMRQEYAQFSIDSMEGVIQELVETHVALVCYFDERSALLEGPSRHRKT